MSELLAALPGIASLGTGGVLLVLVGYLIKANRDDRAQHQETVAALTAERGKEAGDQQGRIDRLENRIDELQAQVDVERELRRAAQDNAAAAVARAAAAELQYTALRQVMGADRDPATSWLPPAAVVPPPRPDGGSVGRDPADWRRPDTARPAGQGEGPP